jgi:4,5-dihydroxyphthalate decarboxylase
MKLNLTLAAALYDRTFALQNGSVTPDGINLNYLEMGFHDLFQRQARHAEFDIAEMSLSTYGILRSRGDNRMVAIPVFTSRRFRHSDIYVNTGAGITDPKDLVGKRVGVPEYQQTAAVWIRGHLYHEYGVRPDQIVWCFGGFNKPERFIERIPVTLPANVSTMTLPDQQSLDQALDGGDIDALLGAGAPTSFLKGSPNVARLFPHYRDVEADYFTRTGIFPVMHTVVIKREIYEQAPWVAMSMYNAFVQAKAEGIRRLRELGAHLCMLPWLGLALDESDAVMGPDPFLYGLGDTNRKVLETLFQYSVEQGLVNRQLTLEELFAPETHNATYN